MKIGILTSSRADYGIYKPLLHKLKDDSFFNLKIIAFGTHLSPYHGYTKKEIEKDGFPISYEIDSMLAGDSPNAIASAMALTSLKFAEFWKVHYNSFDIVFCLGDRYEMYASILAGIPFNIKFAHIHGGETSLGAIDNIFRHSITLASYLHFCSTYEYKKRIAELIQTEDNCLVTGALGLDNLEKMKIMSIEQLKKNFQIDMSIPSVLCTFHPETVEIGKNKKYAEIIAEVLMKITNKYQIIITLSNADTENYSIRERFLKLSHESNNKIICIENFGTHGYFSCMYHCKFLLGNSSSGIIEAASLKKNVINLGDRQKGRLKGNNIINSRIVKEEILKNINKVVALETDNIENPYYAGGAASKIIKFLKSKA